jgi:hypothetical protein
MTVTLTLCQRESISEKIFSIVQMTCILEKPYPETNSSMTALKSVAIFVQFGYKRPDAGFYFLIL